ncbi:MAG: NAD(P)-binding protein [Desulfocucumaceae bacterium]
MRVAIIGAGTSGLSCAVELERNGIYPTIFEAQDSIGDYQPHVSAFLNIIVRPVPDAVKYLHRTLGIKLTPLNLFKKVIHYSPNNQASATGPLGYFFVRGKNENSTTSQIHKQVKSQVHFNSFVRPEDIEKDFDYIVVADGHWSVPKRYGIWREVMRTWVKGGIFAGDFEDDTLKMWLDSKLTKGVYIYSAPYSKQKAIIAQVVQNIEHGELNDYWHNFLESRNILRKYDMIESWELPHQAGYVTTNRVGKLLFAGTAGGGVEPFLGFGQFNAVFTGVMAARSIVKGADINLLLKKLRKKSMELITFRHLMNQATNSDFDRLLAFMKTPGFRSLVYKTNLDIVKMLSIGLKPFISGGK